MLQTLDDATVHRWCGGGLAALRAHQHEIDELNVYPVPDGDTGTNLVLTLISAQEALEGPGADDPASGSAAQTPLGRAMRRMARGALLGARGNSGVIVSQILRGMADTFATAVAVRGGELARALRTATEAAYAAVARPVEGTVLSVVAAAAEGAGRIASDDLVAVARAAARSAAEALARTPQQLPVLARAGVVDAGGRGLCLLLDALVEALSPRAGGDAAMLTTAPAPEEAVAQDPAPPEAARQDAVPPEVARQDAVPPGVGSQDAVPPGVGSQDAVPPGVARQDAAQEQADPRDADRREAAPREAVVRPDDEAGTGAGDLGFEVQYLLDADEDAVAALRRTLDGLGNSLVVVGTGAGDPPTWNVHVHVDVDRIGAAIEAAVLAGRPHRISVTHLTEATGHHVAPAAQTSTEQTVSSAQASARTESSRRTDGRDGRGAVVVAAGEGLTALFTAEGATVVGRNPSIAEMLAAIEATGAGDVVLLPNDANTHAVAASAAGEAMATGVRVSVVPTRSPVQALAALAVRDSGRGFADDVIAMAEAAGACRYGEVCTASREALTVAGRCRPGDLLGLVDGEVHIIGAELEEVSRALLDRMLGGGGELVTLVLGADAPAGLGETLVAHAAQVWPFVEVQSYSGGQPRYHLLVGVE